MNTVPRISLCKVDRTKGKIKIAKVSFGRIPGTMKMMPWKNKCTYIHTRARASYKWCSRKRKSIKKHHDWWVSRGRQRAAAVSTSRKSFGIVYSEKVACWPPVGPQDTGPSQNGHKGEQRTPDIMLTIIILWIFSEKFNKPPCLRPVVLNAFKLRRRLREPRPKLTLSNWITSTLRAYPCLCII